jgi:hypothetical protein
MSRDGGLHVGYPEQIAFEYFYVPAIAVNTPATSLTMGGKVMSDQNYIYATSFYPQLDGGVQLATNRVHRRGKQLGTWSVMTEVTGVLGPGAIAMSRDNAVHQVVACSTNCSVIGPRRDTAAVRVEYAARDGAVDFDAGDVEVEPSFPAAGNVEIGASAITREVLWSYLAATAARNRVYASSNNPSRPSAVVVPRLMDAGVQDGATRDASATDARISGNEAGVFHAVVNTAISERAAIHVASSRRIAGDYQSIDLVRRDGGGLERLSQLAATRIVRTPNPDELIVTSVAQTPNGTILVLVIDGESEFTIAGSLHRFAPDGELIGTPRPLGRVDKGAQIHVINDQDVLVFSSGAIGVGLAVWQSNDGGETFVGPSTIRFDPRSVAVTPMEASTLTAMSIETPSTSRVGWDPYLVRMVLSVGLHAGGQDTFRGAIYLEIPLSH